MNEDPVNSTSTKPRKAGGAPRGNQNSLRHGVYALMQWRRSNGLPDGRTAFGRNFREREKEYTQALGGDLSPMMATLVEDTVWQDFYIATCDQYLSRLRQFVRKGKTHPLVDVRVKLSNSRRENLKLMGFKRVAKEEDSLEDYIARTYGGNRDGGDDEPEPPKTVPGTDSPTSTDGTTEED